MAAELTYASSATYVETILLDERRRSGTVYTPEALTHFVLDQAGLTGGGVLEDAPVLDPACGAGVFLCEVLRRAAHRVDGVPVSGADRTALLAFAKRNLFGIDLDPRARAFTLEALRAVLEELAPGPLPRSFLDANIVLDDFLTGDAVSKLPPIRRGGFAFIVGNPPYVSTTRLESHRKTSLRTMFATAVGRVDLYTLFFERAVQLLRPDGVLAFITPDKFLASETSAALREYLVRHASVRSIARFHSHKVFPDAAVVPCVTVIERQAQSVEMEILSCGADKGGPVAVLSTSRARRDALGAAPWQFRSPELLELVERIRAGRPTLADLARRISAGPATGLDRVYVRPRMELSDIEPELLRPVVRGRDISAFSLADPGLDMIVPFDFSTSEPRLVSLANYPQVRRYLQRYRAELERRHCVRVWDKAWFDLHDSPTADVARETKILVPDLAEHCRFAVDRGRFLPLHSGYYILLHDEDAIDFVAAVLNSSTVEFVLRLLAPVAKDGFSRFRRQFLAAIPVPVPHARTRRDVVRASASSETSVLDDLVATLYGLGRTDMRRIEAYLDARARGVSE